LIEKAVFNENLRIAVVTDDDKDAAIKAINKVVGELLRDCVSLLEEKIKDAPTTNEDDFVNLLISKVKEVNLVFEDYVSDFSFVNKKIFTDTVKKAYQSASDVPDHLKRKFNYI
jgi:hypothetical protein